MRLSSSLTFPCLPFRVRYTHGAYWIRRADPAMRHIIAIPLAPRRSRDQSYERRKREKWTALKNFLISIPSITLSPALREIKKKRKILPIFYALFFSLLAGSLNLGIAVSDRTEISRTVWIDVGVVEGGGGGGRVETKEKGRERVGLGT